MKLFGKAKQQKAAPSTQDSIFKIKDTIETLDKRMLFLQTKIDKEKAEAVRLSKAKNKSGTRYFSPSVTFASYLALA
jgi:hypothetical protein